MEVPPKDPEVKRDFDIDINENVTYTWKDITVSAGESFTKKIANKLCKKERNSPKVLLKEAWGIAKPGELLAIMGSSGAGKTTLLNSLTFRTGRNLEVVGRRCINGKPLNSRILSTISGYVQQIDLFMGTLTVKEQLIFHALLKMNKNIPTRKRLDRVEEVMVELNLKKCENTMIGIAGRVKGISGGEMKRLSFASEMLTDPPLLFCDEPTSGLDSFMAQNVVTVMKEMAQKGKTVISTIHQPSSEVYTMFDKVLFISEGKLAFLGSPQQASAFFKSLGSACPSNHNPADFFIHLLAIAPGKEEECRNTTAMICESYSQSTIGRLMQKAVDDGTYVKEDNNGKLQKNNVSVYKASWCKQFSTVLWRSWLSTLKDPKLFRAKVIQTLLVSILIGLIYFQQVVDQDGVMNINGAIFVSLANMTFQNMFAVIHVFCEELPIFMREHQNGMYRTDIYFLSKTFAELPVFIALPTLFTSIMYYMVGLNPPIDRFLGAVVILVLVGNVATSFGYLMSCLCSNIGIALSVSPPLIIPFLLFGGFFLNTRSIPVYLEWFEHVSWFKYGNEALLVNQWKGIEEIACTRANTTCPKNGAIVLETLNFNDNNYYYDTIMLVVIMLSFRTLAFLALLVRATFKLL